MNDRGLVELVLVQVRECVEADSYVVLSREKNSDFISEYALTKQRQKGILLAMTVDDYCGSEASRNYSGRYVHTFCPNVPLLAVDGHSETVDVYVKLEVESYDGGKQTVVISFHKPEHPMEYAFRQ